jgi:hypothetical protein
VPVCISIEAEQADFVTFRFFRAVRISILLVILPLSLIVFSQPGTGGPKGGSSYTCNGKTITRDKGGNIPDELTQKLSNEPYTLSMVCA